MPGGVAPKFGSEMVSRYTGGPQLQLRVSRYTVQLRSPPQTPEFLTKDFPAATKSPSQIPTTENLVGAKAAPAAIPDFQSLGRESGFLSVIGGALGNLQKLVLGDFCCINFGGFSRGFSWRIFLEDFSGTFCHKNEEKNPARKSAKNPAAQNKNPRKIRSHSKVIDVFGFLTFLHQADSGIFRPFQARPGKIRHQQAA